MTTTLFTAVRNMGSPLISSYLSKYFQIKVIKEIFQFAQPPMNKISDWEHSEYRLWHQPHLLHIVNIDPNEIPLEHFI